MSYEIRKEEVRIETLRQILESGSEISLHQEMIDAVVKCRSYLENAIETSEKPIYGVNTGFGSLCDTSISKEAISELQVNLVISHACGTGDIVSEEISKIMLLLKIYNLAKGYSGIRLETLERLIFMFNNNIIPVIYEQGSLGASGDLAPLAHLSLPLINRGEVWFKGERKSSAEVLKSFDLKPLELGAKEGLALLNGTQFMSAYTTHILLNMKDLLKHSDVITSLSLDSYDCVMSPFSKEIQDIRPHRGQINTAKYIREILAESEIAHADKEYVQDPYSFRCIPQVHGASRDAVYHALEVLEREINSVTDNPMIFPDEDKIISAGNFHGQPLALILDFLAIAIAELSSISERRVFKLISGTRGLPAFLTPNPGLHSGYMIPQYTAASIVSQNKQLCTPASVDTIDSSNGQEDHVSMGANSAIKCLRILKNYRRVLAIELMNAGQAIEFRRPKKSSPKVEDYLTKFRKEVPFQEKDDEWHLLMKKAEAFVQRKDVVN